MDYIIKFMQLLLDDNFTFYGATIKLLLSGKFSQTKNVQLWIYNESDEMNEKYLTYFNISNKTDNKWKLDKSEWKIELENEYALSIKFIEEDKLYKYNKYGITLNKNGLKHKSDIKSLLKTLNEIISKIKPKKKPKSKLRDLHIEWVDYLINNDCQVYGGFLLRYIIDDDLNRDIDVIYENDETKNMFQILIKSDIATKINNDKLKIVTPHGDIIIDYHKKCSNDEYLDVNGDAFCNILKLSSEGLDIRDIPENMTYVETFIKVFEDINKRQYTLMKEFPEKIKNNGDVRLFVKPYFMEKDGFIVNYDYLIKNNYTKTLFDFYVNSTEVCQKCKENNKKNFIVDDKIHCMKCMIELYQK